MLTLLLRTQTGDKAHQRDEIAVRRQRFTIFAAIVFEVTELPRGRQGRLDHLALPSGHIGAA
ncbi:hypothetical protein C1H46_028983 [Malus baccata]|uniref:Uncharacterized protein n=1 Tax=Malus baccata TaxID=106549 RepID=A0A540LG80_MALBA|nr:hypothetical protein C1H46_028983 [Malus baccata]